MPRAMLNPCRGDGRRGKVDGNDGNPHQHLNCMYVWWLVPPACSMMMMNDDEGKKKEEEEERKII